MPELNRSRKIWIYLPNDYNTSNQKRFPVIYMHDGQNLFDAVTSFAGEWQVDETLTSIQQAGGYGTIVVGVDNGGSSRINEYSPWVNTQYGGGEGDLYIDFIKNTLKPHIDQNYRTLIEPQNTGLIGSSMGGLISLYGTLKYPATFGKAGVFSPSLWFARTQLTDYITGKNFTNIPLKFYFIGGTSESVTLVADMQMVRTALINTGVESQHINLLTHTDGAHSEWYWRRKFGASYQFLFPAPYFSTSTANINNKADFRFFYNKENRSFSINGLQTQNVPFKIFTPDGKIIRQGIINDSEHQIILRNLKQGVHFVRFQLIDGIITRKLMIE
ncbi:MAG: alpha/beta hydrolase-fold protein [Paludibacter sp.]|nr:alpha/beta hydrolase-fold protein [Paludibacter sp.]